MTVGQLLDRTGLEPTDVGYGAIPANSTHELLRDLIGAHAR